MLQPPPLPWTDPDAAWRLDFAWPEDAGVSGPPDPAQFLAQLRRAALRRGCAVHAYVLLPDRFQMIATALLPGAIDRLLRDLARPSTGGPTGPGWRLRAARRLANRDLLPAMRELDQAPILAGLVADPLAWAWGSHRACALGAPDVLACPHAAYLALARGRSEQRRRYRCFVSPPGYHPDSPGRPASPP